MKFYKSRAKVDDKLINDLKRRSKKSFSNEFEKRVEIFAKEACLIDETALDESFGKDYFINFSSIDMVKATLIMATERNEESTVIIKRHISEYLHGHDYEGCLEKLDEITGKAYRQLLHDSEQNGFIEDFDDTMERYRMKSIRYGFSFEEFLLDGKRVGLEEAMNMAEEQAVIPALQEEIGRIYATKRRTWKPGNPVHYVIAADDGADKHAYFMLLMKALYAAGRIGGRRFTSINYEDLCNYYDSEKLNELYRLQTSGVMAIHVFDEYSADGDASFAADDGENHAADICRMAMKWKNTVLTVFLFPRDSGRQQTEFFSEMDGISLIRIEEGVEFDGNARAFLRRLAADNRLSKCKELYAGIEKGVGYSRRDLRRMFDQWYGGYLKGKVFPQYADTAIVMSKAKRGAKGRGFTELGNLIGLAETKALVENILDFAKVQSMYLSGDARVKQSLHMIFTGNPGTAKTTVARILAQILKENEVLQTGDLFEVGRADLVGKYIGHTAPLVKQQFRKAKGSVLFVDEAYSLVDDRDGCYGDEAITAIVQEMENMRDEVVVIFAGYPDKMERFLAKNPGLRSRIGFHVNFPDYTPAELFEIMELLARNDRIELADGVRERVFPMIEKAARVRGFGNGRYVRNLLEKARMHQATRLIRMGQEKVTEQVAATLVADDFEEIRLSGPAAEKRVGFI